jgi:hypothetical protein
MHALWYVLPVTVVSVVVLFIVVGLRYLYKGKTPPLWLQFACIVPFMLFSLRYWYLPIEMAAGMFSGIYLTLPISEFGVCSCGFLVYPP